MVEIIKIGKACFYPESQTQYRQLLLRDTESQLETVFSLTDKYIDLWADINEFLENQNVELRNIHGQVVKHTDTFLDHKETLNVIIDMGVDDDPASFKWLDQYNKKHTYRVLDTTMWVWSKY